MKYLVTAAAASALLAGCSEVQNSWTAFNSEAGSQIDTGDFGNASMNNMLVQTGQSDYTINLARRFNSEVNATINFAFNSSALDAGAQATLRKQADWIKQFPEVRFRVYGHTDLVGSAAYNKRLGLSRANAAVNFLVGQGISRSRLEAVASFGETRPVVNTADQNRENRRTVTEVSGFVRNHPTVLNGKYAEIIFRDYVESAIARPDAAALGGGAGGGDSGG
ncbi:OmpA family protein [Yoonia sp. R2331]|uniref:OmpA family protein n=1 Tax=Yoonia sp. R2331 TaxID=3237238 RepID=UPI0034E4118D